MRVRTHPGEVLLEEFLKPNNMTAHALALAISVPYTRISDIVHQKRGVSADTAARLSRFFGNSAEFWLNLQNAHDLSIVEMKKDIELQKILPLSAYQGQLVDAR